MADFGVIVKYDTGGTRVELKCKHQNGLLYATPAESSWVCTDELRHAHALAGFLGDLVKLQDPRIHEMMQRWGLYYRSRPLETNLEGDPGARIQGESESHKESGNPQA